MRLEGFSVRVGRNQNSDEDGHHKRIQKGVKKEGY